MNKIEQNRLRSIVADMKKSRFIPTVEELEYTFLNLLDALDEMEKDRDGWKCRNENNIKALEETITERDRWKARAEAFERALKTEPAFNHHGINKVCFMCANNPKDMFIKCEHTCDNFDDFIFDEARFTDGDENNE